MTGTAKSTAEAAAQRIIGTPQRAVGEGTSSSDRPPSRTESTTGGAATERPVGTAFSVVETYQQPQRQDAAPVAPVVEPIGKRTEPGLAVMLAVGTLLAAATAAFVVVWRMSRRRTV